MKQILLVLSTLLFLSLFSSCKDISENVLNTEDQSSKQKKDDITMRITNLQKSDFNDLSTEDKIAVWQEKIMQIIGEDLNEEQRDLVTEIYAELPQVALSTYDGIRLAELGLEMARITPEDEYIRMFEMLEDYQRDETLYVGNFESENLISDMEFFLSEVQNNKKIYAAQVVSPKSCHCKWTCGFYSGNTDNCTKTDSGCGFLWMSSCTGVIL